MCCQRQTPHFSSGSHHCGLTAGAIALALLATSCAFRGEPAATGQPDLSTTAGPQRLTTLDLPPASERLKTPAQRALSQPQARPQQLAAPEPPGLPERPLALKLETGTFSSTFWPGQKVRWRLVRPAAPVSASTPQPLVVALHGRGGDADWPYDRVQIMRHVARTGLAVASVDGGSSYWHLRRSGVDTGQMVLQELLPLMSRKGLDTHRIGLMGWSMGGYGALRLASKLGPQRVAGVVAVSAALWQSPKDRAAGAFDDSTDFARNDIFAAHDQLRGIPVRLDCGREDHFFKANQAFARELPGASVTFDQGGHDDDYWRTHAGGEMNWLRQRLP